jgi:hypothetical protein
MAISSDNLEAAGRLLRNVKTEFTTFRKSSVKTNQTDFLEVFQDPTYLCFRIFFIGLGSATAPKTAAQSIQNDPVINKTLDSNFGKKLSSFQKGFAQSSTKNPYNDDYNTGLFGPIDNENSALYYLNSIGDNARVTMLYDFINLLSKINTLYPWYFQQLDGLGEAWKRDYSKPKFKKELTIQCLESIDLRITGLMDLYRKIVWDWKNRRYILPDNLRKFSMLIKVYDWRDFTVFPKNNPNDIRDAGLPLSEGADSFLSTRSAKINKSFLGAEKVTDRTQISFNFKFCEFEPDDSGTFMSSISNATPTMATQSIKISYQEIEEDNIYRSLVALSSNPSFYFVKDYLDKEIKLLDTQEPLLKAPDAINDALANLGQNITTNISSRASRLITSKLNNLFSGNVYGFSSTTVIADPLGTVRRTASNIVEDTNNSKASKQMGNVFDEIHQRNR